MCRTTDFHHGFHDKDRLKIKAFLVSFSGLNLHARKTSLPESLTLLYLPRVNNGGLEIGGNKIRSGFPGFVTLYRVVGAKGVVFASREKVRVGDGACFEVYLGEDKVLKGVFRKDDEEDKWKLECRCALEGEEAAAAATAAEVCAATEEAEVMKERVEMVAKRKRKKRGVCELEEIPEESEEDEEEEETEECCYCCSCDGGDDGEERESEEEEEERERVEMEAEGVGWAVDMGIWVMCLGVGYLVSRASAKKLLRKRYIL